MRFAELFSRMRRGWARALDALFPRGANCLCCGDPRRANAADSLCDDCRAALKKMRVPAEACDRCLSPVRRGEKCAFCASPAMRDIEAVFAPYRYGGAVRPLIHAFKFNACDEALPTLADAMADALGGRQFDCITPVPLHKKRLRQRGVNQALLLAQALALRAGCPVRELLRRDRYQKPQSRLPLEMRRGNVAGAFSCKEGAKGLRVLLVDDVRTSGSTAAACAGALRAAGAESVYLCVSAVVYRGRGQPG